MAWQLKSREPRRKISIPARLRSNNPDQAVWIRNVSSRGMMVQSDDPPQRGDYVEIIVPNLSVVGRVVWTVGRNFGVYLSDKIDVDALIKGLPPPPPRPARNDRRPYGLPERRRAGADEVAARNRQIGNWMQFGTIVAFTLTAGFGIFLVLHEILWAMVTAIVPGLQGPVR